LLKDLESVWFESFGGKGRGEEIFNLKCLVQFLEEEGRGGEGRNFIALPKLSLH